MGRVLPVFLCGDSKGDCVCVSVDDCPYVCVCVDDCPCVCVCSMNTVVIMTSHVDPHAANSIILLMLNDI